MNTIVTTAEISTTAPADALAGNTSMPCIELPANATFSIEREDEWTAPVITNAHNAIVSLIADQEEWLNGVHRAANEQLYRLLQRCYHLYTLMADDKVQNENLKAALEKFNKAGNLGMKEKSHTLNKIIKVVFGADRRRASAYCLALRVALAEKVKVADLPKYLRDAGGVEEVRRRQANGGAAKVDKVAEATKHTANVTLAVVNADAISGLLDCAAHGKQVVLLATQDVGGALNINAVVQTENVAKAVLTAIYNADHKDWEKKNSQKQELSEDEELEALIAEAADEAR